MLCHADRSHSVLEEARQRAAAGATHTAEAPLLFGTWEDWGDWGPGERPGGQAPRASAVSHELVTAWSAFLHGDATAGAPNPPATGAASSGYLAATPSSASNWRNPRANAITTLTPNSQSCIVHNVGTA